MKSAHADPLAPSPAASPEQREACPPPDDPRFVEFDRMATMALAEPDPGGDCLRCHLPMRRPDRGDGEDATPLCHACAQEVLATLATAVLALSAEVRRLRERETTAARDRAIGLLVRHGWLAAAQALASGAASAATIARRLRRSELLLCEPGNEDRACIAAVEALASVEPPQAGEEREDG
jgi:hypothetical protein